MARYWIRRRSTGAIRGPYESSELQDFAECGQLTTADEVATDDDGPWFPADTISWLKLKVDESYDLDEVLGDSVIVTTGSKVEGFRIVRYIDIDGVEIVTGTGLFAEASAALGDFMGGRSTSFESKLRNGRRTALTLLKGLASEKGANAIIGIDFDYTEFGSNRTGIIATGTFVKVTQE